MTRENEDAILKAYDEKVGLYRTFADRLAQAMRDLLSAEHLDIHSVSCRVKERQSLEQKLRKPEHAYLALADVTDITGVRVVTYFEDDVDRIARMIEREFVVDVEHSTDKRVALDPDRFGYLSMHHVVSITDARCQLFEWRPLKGLLAEIQTRSILQHAWAEIEHDLGYKSSKGVPRQLRRGFSRLAGLLELADKEFVEIKNALRKYEREVEGLVERDADAVGIDTASLRVFVEGDGIVGEMDRAIAKTRGAVLLNAITALDRVAQMLDVIGVKTIGDLRKQLGQSRRRVLKFAETFLRSRPAPHIARGISLMHLVHYTIASTGKLDIVVPYLDMFGFDALSRRRAIAEEMIRAAAEADKA